MKSGNSLIQAFIFLLFFVKVSFNLKKKKKGNILTIYFTSWHPDENRKVISLALGLHLLV